METVKKKKLKNRLISHTKKFSNRFTSLEDLVSLSQTPETDVLQNKLLTTKKKTMPEYLGFKKHPFGDSLDTSFFYKSSHHETTLLKMKISIEHDISFGMVIGKSGTGKTLISQALLETLPREKYHPVLVPVTPNLSKSAFLKMILKGLDVECDKKRDINGLVDMLAEKIIFMYNKNIKPVLLVDECHFLSSQALHILRTLSNFEAFHKKLLTCILFSEPSFLRRLNNPFYASLKSRIYLDVELKALDFDECVNYIKFRLLVAGKRKENFFSNEQLKMIFEVSKGIPRHINKECTKLMVDNYVARK